MEGINGSETRRRVNWKRKRKLRWKLKRKNVGFEESGICEEEREWAYRAVCELTPNALIGFAVLGL